MHSCCIVDCSSETASITTVISLWLVGVSIHWTGLLDWTTGLTQTAIKYLLSVEQKLNIVIQPVTLLMLVP